MNGGEMQLQEEVFLWIISNITKLIYHKYLEIIFTSLIYFDTFHYNFWKVSAPDNES